MPEKSQSFILWFDQLVLADTSLVGGKNAALGEMYSWLIPLGIAVPNGFAITAHAYDHFLTHNNLSEKIEKILVGLDTGNVANLQKRGREIRELILKGEFPQDLSDVIKEAYHHLGLAYFENPDVAVRSSATAEDLPGASFAGQQETYLNIVGNEALLLATRKCFASLFTDRAISYRVDKGFKHTGVSLSVGVQKMVRADLATSGVAFTIDTETGFDKVVIINGSYGLGEMVVQGKVTPDEFVVFKPALAQGFRAIVAKNLGPKQRKMIYTGNRTKLVAVPKSDREKFCLTEEEVILLARWCVQIEEHFSKLHKRFQPMDIEWAKDGESGRLFIVQARPETVHSKGEKREYEEYRLTNKEGKRIVVGTAVGTKIASGSARVIKNIRGINTFEPGEVLVTEITDPDWEPIMKVAAAIVTDKGGRTSHAAIVSRELGIPCVVGSKNATKTIKTGEVITVDCSSGDRGIVYQGKIPFKVIKQRLEKIPQIKTRVALNIGSPDEAFKNHYLPVEGVGLGRVEFIIASHIRIHPRALIDYPKLKQQKSAQIRSLVKKIDEQTTGYQDKKQFYVDELAEGISKIAAAFWPNDVIIRFSDFKTNEYRKLLGGELFEPEEENPMLGWRGASRYYHPKFKEAFGLECLALRKAREEIGLENIVPMVPFCRTPEEGKRVLETMAAFGLERKPDSKLKIYVMCEIPTNILQADAFLDIFDGMSIGSNDLTQLTVGLDRDSALTAGIANENNPAVLKLIEEAIARCRARGKYSGICGQAPSDFPEFVAFLVKAGIESISLNPDSVIKTIIKIAEVEK